MEKITVFYNARILRGYNIISDELWVKNDKIISPLPLEVESTYKRVNCENLILAPGLIDLQVNGAFGVDFLTHPDLPRALEYVNKKMLSTGVTSYCPTLITSPPDYYHKTLPLIKPCKGSPESGAGILGVHCEGPFISKAKCGAHPTRYIIELDNTVRSENINLHDEDSDKSENLCKCDSPNIQHTSLENLNLENPLKPDISHSSGNEPIETLIHKVYGDISNLRLITIACEFPRAIEAIEYFTRSSNNIIVSLGHSQTNYEQAIEAVKSGARMITHLFNAMPAFHHRNPSLPGLLCSEYSDQVFYGIISDGVHTHPAALRIAHALAPNTLVLVTDALAPMNLENGEYKLGKQTIVVKNNRATVKDTNILCGCISSLPYCMRFFTQAIPCSKGYTLAAATLHPAKCMKVESSIGTLEPGTNADFILMDDDFNIRKTYISGKLGYDSQNPINYDEQYADVLQHIYN